MSKWFRRGKNAIIPLNPFLSSPIKYFLRFLHNSLWISSWFLAPQSGALRISAYRDFQSHPTLPLIAFEHLSLSMVISNSPSRPRQINVDQCRPKFSKISKNFQKFPKKFQKISSLTKFPEFSKKNWNFPNFRNFSKFSKCSKIFQMFQNILNFQNFPISKFLEF